VKGFLRIGYNRIALHGPLLALVRRYRELHPEVKVELIFLPSREQCADVAAGTLDAGFIVGSPTTEVEAMVVDDEKLVAALPLGHPLGDGPIPISRLANQPFVLGDRLIWGTYVPIVHEACRKAGFQPNIVQEAGTSEAVLGLVAAGFGVTLYLRRHGDAPGVVFADLTDCDDTVQTVLVWRPGERSPQLNRFLALTREMVPHSVLRLRVRRNLVPAPAA
jgi:DNA-binding transcriptional LysR family regulator